MKESLESGAFYFFNQLQCVKLWSYPLTTINYYKNSTLSFHNLVSVFMNNVYSQKDN